MWMSRGTASQTGNRKCKVPGARTCLGLQFGKEAVWVQGIDMSKKGVMDSFGIFLSSLERDPAGLPSDIGRVHILSSRMLTSYYCLNTRAPSRESVVPNLRGTSSSSLP
jgi:hypothetical protein